MVTEVVVCVNSIVAREAGFRPDRLHHADDRILAWWPGLGVDALRGYELERVTFINDVWRYANERDRRELEGARIMLRERLRRGAEVWIEG
ncbi:hypothetical protein [Phenylobacterium sp.]|uniref:hypothetical protein n=1 Tax=Phenylobacterium sp. TaxID=1871053 RepID=UPI002DF1C692|nr:hypothetical protein [Phenylobacterium sp.]